MFHQYSPILIVSLFFLVSSPSICTASYLVQEKEMSLESVVVDVKGEKVTIPLPNNYEIMNPDDEPQEYDWMMKVALNNKAIPLVVLIHSEDKKKIKKDKKILLRTALIYGEMPVLNMDTSEDSLNDVRDYLIDLEKRMWIEINNKAAQSNKSGYDYFYIYNGNKSLSVARIQGFSDYKKYRSVSIHSTVELGNKIISMDFYLNNSKGIHISSIIEDTLCYLRNIEYQNY